MVKARSCSSPAQLTALMVLVIISFLIVSVLCQTVSRRTTAYSNRTAPETFKQQMTTELIYVYTEGCAHCKQFDPTWTSFTQKYSDDLTTAGVKARRVKSDDSSIEDLGVRGYPAVVLLSRTNDFPQKVFDGERSVPGLAGFVQENIPSFSP